MEAGLADIGSRSLQNRTYDFAGACGDSPISLFNDLTPDILKAG